MAPNVSSPRHQGEPETRRAALQSKGMQWLLHFRNRYLLLFDVFALPLATFLAFVARLGVAGLQASESVIGVSLLISLFLKPLVFHLNGLYSHYWPLAGFSEALRILLATFLAEIGQTALVVIIQRAVGGPALPRSIPFLDFLFTLFSFAGPRFGLRWLYEALHRRQCERPPSVRRVLIVGAGEAGSSVAREIQQNPGLGLQLVGFVDDDPVKQTLRVNGVQVVGQLRDISRIVEAQKVDQVLIAIPSASPAVIRQIVDLCRAAQAEPLILPGMSQLVSGRVELQRFRKVQLEDLLARPPVHTDTTAVRQLLQGRRILVTGAGGSIGSELCRQIARCEPAQLLLLGHGENSIFTITNELRRDFPDLNLQPLIADIRDAGRLEAVFGRFQPETVFHAAAHKHVPLMEDNPEEAVTNNVLGTRNLLELAERHAVDHLVMISTDKAVHPSSVMGATKRVAERLVQDAACRTGRCYVAVRFGNVLGSRGSVVPLFQEQIAHGGPVTVTHPEVKRYFMTIPEAVQLVLQAAVLGQGGEIYVLDMGEPVKIVDLARDLIRLAGLREGEDIEIVFTGLRPGEKLFEELFLEGEAYHRTAHEKIFVSQNGVCESAPERIAQVEQLIAAAHHGDAAEVCQLLHTLAPPENAAAA